MNPTVYLETSIVGYLASRPSRDLITAANQQMTHDWWNDHRMGYELYVSEVVLDECNAGDPEAARERLNFLEQVEVLDATEEAKALSRALLDRVPLPEIAAVDALHIAIADFNGLQYLVTWNCRHIANATLLDKIESVCRSEGYEPPKICTPQQLLED